mmetsp:Transcript_13919/g.30424  ORF Transcript_13919/g.30424 Transcript_13919/m.30424 type:complete len:253 (+) Transcript_13919:76-834(+)
MGGRQPTLLRFPPKLPCTSLFKAQTKRMMFFTVGPAGDTREPSTSTANVILCQPHSLDLLLGKEVSVFLVGTSRDWVVRPELRGQVLVSVSKSKEDGHDVVTHGTGVTLRTAVAILHTSHVHELLSGRGRNQSGTTRSGDETNTNGTALSSHLHGHSVGQTSRTSPVTTTDGAHVQLGGRDSSTNGIGDFGRALDTHTNVSIVVSNSHKGLETSTLTSRRLLLHRHDFHNFILELVLQEIINNFRFFDGKRK